RPGHFWMGGNRRLETLHQTCDLAIARSKWRHLNVAAGRDRKVVTIGIASSDPDRNRILDRLRRAGRFRKRPEFASMRVIAIPKLLHNRDELAHPLTGAPGIKPGGETLVLKRVCTSGDPKIETAVRGDVRHRSFAGKSDGVPKRRDDVASAKP